MLPAHVKLKDIDYPLRDLVVEMNKIPFVDTISTCSGHLDSRRHGTRRVQITDNKHLSEGRFSFQIDDRYLLVPEFVESLEHTVRAYPFASFEQRESGYRLPPPESPYYDKLSRAAAKEVQKYLEDFGRYASHNFSITATGIGLSFGQLEQAKRRLDGIYEMWGHLTGVCRDFQRRSDLHRMLL